MTTIVAVNYSTLLKNAEQKTGHQRTLQIIDAWYCWLEKLGKGCEKMQVQEQQAIAEGKHAEFIATAGSPLPLDFHTDGLRILDLLAKEALIRKISSAPFHQAMQYVACEFRFSAKQCALPIEEQHQEANRVMGNCRSELEAAIMVLEEPPEPAAVADAAVKPERKALTDDEQIIFDAIPVLPKTIAGKAIVERVATKLPSVDEARVSRICTKTLKAYGVKNRRGAGYYRTA